MMDLDLCASVLIYLTHYSSFLETITCILSKIFWLKYPSVKRSSLETRSWNSPTLYIKTRRSTVRSISIAACSEGVMYAFTVGLLSILSVNTTWQSS